MVDLHALAAQTARLLPDGPWEAAADRDRGSCLTHRDGRRIRIEAARRPGYVDASPVYPETDFALTDAEEPSTAFRADRSAPALARAIVAKLLPVYNETYPKVLARNAQRAQQIADGLAQAEHLLDLVPHAAIVRDDPSFIVEHDGPFPVRAQVHLLSDGIATVTLRYIDAATTEAVMQAYAAHVPHHSAT
ncbi:hypothetical protein G3I40_12300 [Streptomyces sp. SID14478]|uniref:hypothetical protein n=1 Tax=Streptomyces sp. SID14478 TaxID=2706073 RepID=UPI0013D948F0|nr:hypothetical protein [Streptomyces sp. SID14478]NEB75996.1 hypothetical protein [Streptomyces sp. SID14478]